MTGFEVMYLQKDIKAVNKTSRGSGAVGTKALVPRYVMENVNTDKTVLDFGAGKQAVHSKRLSEKGYKVVAFDFGDNQTDFHNDNALDETYNVIMLSNVLNVQQSLDMLNNTLIDVNKAMDSNTSIYANYPTSPRYLGVSKKELKEQLNSLGFSVTDATKDVMEIKRK